MRFATLASGSSGNCTYIGNDNVHILVDAGISCKRITDGIGKLGIKGSELDGIFITHEHSDHISGLRVLSKKFGVPIYTTKETADQICSIDSKGEIDRSLFHYVNADERVHIKDMSVLPFSNSHDAANPVAYRVEADGQAAAVVTDLGVYSDYTLEHLKNLDIILLESNHDIRMLETGPYPFSLKRRILGAKGHLSNETAGRLLDQILNDNIKHILLGHLSKENNYEQLAYQTVCCEVDMSDSRYHSKDFPITVADRNSLTDVINI